MLTATDQKQQDSVLRPLQVTEVGYKRGRSHIYIKAITSRLHAINDISKNY